MKKNFQPLLRGNRGQAMLLTVLALGASILGVTTIAGMLMLYQIRATGNSVQSARAVFSADSGVEWALFERTQTTTATSSFANGATDDIICFDATGTTITPDCTTASGAAQAISKGQSGNSRRAFFVSFGSTTSLP
jgi:uncharacterized membrane protein